MGYKDKQKEIEYQKERRRKEWQETRDSDQVIAAELSNIYKHRASRSIQENLEAAEHFKQLSLKMRMTVAGRRYIVAKYKLLQIYCIDPYMLEKAEQQILGNLAKGTKHLEKHGSIADSERLMKINVIATPCDVITNAGNPNMTVAWSIAYRQGLDRLRNYNDDVDYFCRLRESIIEVNNNTRYMPMCDPYSLETVVKWVREGHKGIPDSMKEKKKP